MKNVYFNDFFFRFEFRIEKFLSVCLAVNLILKTWSGGHRFGFYFIIIFLYIYPKYIIRYFQYLEIILNQTDSEWPDWLERKLIWNYLDRLGLTWKLWNWLVKTWTDLDRLGQTWTDLDWLGQTWTDLDRLKLTQKNFDLLGLNLS